MNSCREDTRSLKDVLVEVSARTPAGQKWMGKGASSHREVLICICIGGQLLLLRLLDFVQYFNMPEYSTTSTVARCY